MNNNIFSGGIPFGNGTVNADLNDSELNDVLLAYKRKVAGNYRPLLLDDFNSLPKNNLLVSTKIDGELCFLVSISKIVFLANAGGKVIFGDLPVLEEVKDIPDDTIIAGELYVKNDDRRPRVGDLPHLLAEKNNGDPKKLCFAAFDLLKISNLKMDAPYRERYNELKKIVSSDNQLRVAVCEEMDRNQLLAKFESEVKNGQIEGLVIRLPGGQIYKLKPEITIDAVIVAYTNKSEQPHLARSVLVGLMHPDEKIQILGACGNLGSDEDRKKLNIELKNIEVDTNVRYASDGGNLYTFVKPEIIIEIKVSDFQLERSDGHSSVSMKLDYKNEKWIAGPLTECPRPIHPVMTRIRTDKSTNKEDIRFSQIERFIIQNTKLDKVSELENSVVIRREVWKKNIKDSLAVRKLLVWKTNKDIDSLQFPSFVVHWTDFSPGRASPLNREVKLAPDEQTALTIADELINENIKKGWEKV